jgi:hypothetical protein
MKTKKSVHELSAMFARAAETIEAARDAALAQAAQRLGAAVVEELQARARERPAMAGLFSALEDSFESRVTDRALIGFKGGEGREDVVEQATELELGHGKGVRAPILAQVAARSSDDLVTRMREHLADSLTTGLTGEGRSS